MHHHRLETEFSDLVVGWSWANQVGNSNSDLAARLETEHRADSSQQQKLRRRANPNYVKFPTWFRPGSDLPDLVPDYMTTKTETQKKAVRKKLSDLVNFVLRPGHQVGKTSTRLETRFPTCPTWLMHEYDIYIYIYIYIYYAGPTATYCPSPDMDPCPPRRPGVLNV